MDKVIIPHGTSETVYEDTNHDGKVDHEYDRDVPSATVSDHSHRH